MNINMTNEELIKEGKERLMKKGLSEEEASRVSNYLFKKAYIKAIAMVMGVPLIVIVCTIILINIWIL